MKKVKFYPFLNNKPDRSGLYHVFLRCHKKDEKRKVLPTEIRITKSSWNANAKFKAADGFRISGGIQMTFVRAVLNKNKAPTSSRHRGKKRKRPSTMWRLPRHCAIYSF